MTRDEIRGLVGGYATGSLTEAERAILFNAALTDQELFDELAREQALKSAIDQPGARERLLLAVAPKPWWRTAWVWAAAGAAAVALVSGIIVMRSPRQPEQLARVEVPAPPVAPPVEPPATPAPALPPAPPKVAPPKETSAQAAPSAQPRLAEPSAVSQATLQPPAAPQALATPEPAPEAAREQAAAPVKKETASSVAGTVSGVPAGVAGARGGGGGGGGLRANRALVAPQAARAPVPRFAFDYSVTPEGALRVTVAANGFLSVSANNGTTDLPVLTARQVQAGSVTEAQLPADAVSATVLFMARERTYLAGSFNFGAGSDPLSGTKSDPNPSPDSVLLAHIQLKP